MKSNNKSNREYEELRERVSNLSKDEKIKVEDAFPLFILKDVLGLEESIYDEALDAGGPKDCGIDAFWVNDDVKEVCLLQSKYYNDNHEVDENEIDNFLNSPSILLAPPASIENRCKKYIQEKSQDYKEYIDRSYDTRLIFATSSSYKPAARTKAKIFNTQHKDAKVDLLDASEIMERLADLRRSDKPSLKFSLQNGYHEHKSKDIPYVVCSVFGDDLARAYREHKGNVLEQNLRYGLQGGQINKGIEATLKDSGKRKNFWYYNNGITIICDNYEIKEGSIFIQNAQIVNGAQTTKTIYGVSLSLGLEPLRDASVLARIIKTNKDEDLISDIRNYNNKQNPTKPRDFVSHLKEQERLQIEFEPLGYFYEIKRGEKYEETKVKWIKRNDLTIIDNLTVAQAHCSFLGKPAQAKSQKNSLLDPSGEFYKEIFAVNAKTLLLAYKCYEFAKSSLKEFKKHTKNISEDKDFMLHGTTHIVAVMGKLIAEVVGIDKIVKDDDLFKKYTSSGKLKLIYDNAVEFIDDLYSSKLDVYHSEKLAFSASRYFKNAEEATTLLDKIDKKIKKNITKLEKEIELT
jgi:hypothetical protein